MNSLYFIEHLLDLNVLGLVYTEFLSVTMLSVEQECFDADYDQSDDGDTQTYSNIKKIKRPEMIYATTLNHLIRLLIRRVPSGRLRKFQYASLAVFRKRHPLECSIADFSDNADGTMTARWGFRP